MKNLFRHHKKSFALLAFGGFLVGGGLLPIFYHNILRACGPFFPNQVLENRKEFIAELPKGGFAHDIIRIFGPFKAEQGQVLPDYGAQALEALYYNNHHYNWISFNSHRADLINFPAERMRRIIDLYLLQSRTGDKSGPNSLAFLYQWILSSPEATQKYIQDETSLTLAMLFMQNNAYDYYERFNYNNRDNAKGQLKTILTNLIVAIQQNNLQVQDYASLIEMTYQAGLYPQTTWLLDRVAEKEPLSVRELWIKAKITAFSSAETGDWMAAAQAYQKAVTKAEEEKNTTKTAIMNQAHMRVEQGIITLARGQYIEAFATMYGASLALQTHKIASDSQGWDGTDISSNDLLSATLYMAENILTTDELKAYVDAHIKPKRIEPEDYSCPFDLQGGPVQNNIRYLLARRLVRDGRIRRALPYFPDDNTPCITLDGVKREGEKGAEAEKKNSLRKWALDYNNALVQAHKARTATTRAENWYKAGLIVKEHGLALMGTQNWPDDVIYLGSISSPASQPPQKPYGTDEEIKRFNKNQVSPMLRYHYRYKAVDYMMRAADNLPPRSQAFAAILCRAASWDTGMKAEVYRRYIRQGAYVPFGTEFGKPHGRCPTPNFTRARYFSPIQVWLSLKRRLHLD